MSRVYGRKDRTARLVKIQILLCQHPEGIEIKEIARRCGITKRTIYRDLRALESELEIPLWGEGSKRGVVEGHFLPPIFLNSEEAINIFLAIRLMQKYSYLYNPSIISTSLKLSTIVPPVLRKHIEITLGFLEKQPKNETKITNFDKLAKAWITQRLVTFYYKKPVQYKEVSDGKPHKVTIEPYFIEPVAWGRSSYIIGRCPPQKSLKAFKIDRIVGDVVIEPQTYEVPDDFNAMEYIWSGWEIYSETDLYTVKLRFNETIGNDIKETIWHPSQKIETQSDGSIIMTLKVRNSIDFHHWVLGMGGAVEVLEPEVLRQQIVKDINNMIDIYLPEKSKNRSLNSAYPDIYDSFQSLV